MRIVNGSTLIHLDSRERKPRPLHEEYGWMEILCHPVWSALDNRYSCLAAYQWVQLPRSYVDKFPLANTLIHGQELSGFELRSLTREQCNKNAHCPESDIVHDLQLI